MPIANRFARFFRQFLCCACLCLVCAGTAAAADKLLDLGAPFQPGELTSNERTFLQAGLILYADYDGPLNGDWNSETQAAMERFFATSNLPGPVPNWAALLMAFDTDSVFQVRRWKSHHLDHMGISLLIPFANLEVAENNVSFKDLDSSLEYEIFRNSKARMDKYHSRDPADVASIEKQRDEAVWTTTASYEDRLVYIYSQRLDDGRWATVGIYASRDDARDFALVKASIMRGYREPVTASDRLNKGIDHVVLKLDRLARAQEAAAEEGIPAEPNADEAARNAVATGFAVSSQGHVLTSLHVLESCAGLKVSGHPASLIARDPEFDLALLEVPGLTVENPAAFARAPAALNMDVTVAGYPLSGILGGFNVTRGAVTSLKGLAGTGVTVQISAPVQQGMTGGPVVNRKGEIIGVVAAKLDAKKVAEIIGDVPQNVNFAVSGEIAQLFLFQNGITPSRAPEQSAMVPERMADHLSGFTLAIACKDAGN